MKVLKGFYHYIFLHPKLFFAYLLLTTVAQSLSNFQPFFFKWIAAAAAVGNFSSATRLVFGLGAVLLANTLIHSLSVFISDRSTMKSAVDLQMDVMKKVHDLDFSYHTEKSSGRLISIMKRGEDAFLNLDDILNRELYWIFISMCFMLYAFQSVSPRYLVFSLTILAVSLTASVPLISLNLKKRRLFVDADDQVSAARVDNLVNFDTVKYFAKEAFEQRRLKTMLADWYQKAQDFFTSFRYFDLVIGNLANLAITGTIFLSVLDLASGHIGLPDFILISSFSAIFFPKLMGIMMTLRGAAKRYGDLQQYLQVLDEEVDVKDPSHPQTISPLKGRISFHRVSFHYKSGPPVFADFSLDITPGESVALVGLSGSGKTTFVKLLMRMYDVSSGQITIDGTDIKDMAKTYLRSLIGIVPQDPLMFNHSILYNVGYAQPDASEPDIWSALESAKLADFVRSLPDALATKVGERGIKLSGGQRQRLAIARVLLEKPKIIVFDEATSSLDSESEGAVQEAFWAMVKDPADPKTSIIIAHRLSTVMKTDRIIALRDGTIAEAGTHRSLLRRPHGLYRHLWDLQQNGFLADSD